MQTTAVLRNALQKIERPSGLVLTLRHRWKIRGLTYRHPRLRWLTDLTSTQEDTQQQEPAPLLLFTSTIPVLKPDVSTSPHLSATSASSASLTSHRRSQAETPPSSPDTPCISQSAEMAKPIRKGLIKPSSDAMSASEFVSQFLIWR